MHPNNILGFAKIMIKISNTNSIPESEMEFHFVRAQGAGGQHVNKASTAVHLRFNFIKSNSLPDFYKKRLLTTNDRRISQDGVIIIKAQKYRSQEMNKEDAMRRLAQLIRSATTPLKKRRPTSPTKGSQVRRLNKKTKAARTKQLRKKVRMNDW